MLWKSMTLIWSWNMRTQSCLIIRFHSESDDVFAFQAWSTCLPSFLYFFIMIFPVKLQHTYIYWHSKVLQCGASSIFANTAHIHVFKTDRQCRGSLKSHQMIWQKGGWIGGICVSECMSGNMILHPLIVVCGLMQYCALKCIILYLGGLKYYSIVVTVLKEKILAEHEDQNRKEFLLRLFYY